MEAGGTDGFDEFYTASFGRLVGQLFFVTGDVQDAEDVVQEAMARAAARWPQIRGYDVPEHWVRRVAMNLALDGLRRARRRVGVMLRLGPPPDVPPASEDGVAIITAMRTLSPRHRQVLVLHHLVGLTVEEIARHLSIPTGTVKTRLARGRRILASRLDSTAEGVAANHG
jgi:RNA polymerase sigma-70 factor (ECF subfamily)